MSLTPRQFAAQTFIIDTMTATNGIAPTYAQIGVACGISGKSGVSRVIEGLVQRGYLKKPPRRQRSFVVLRDPRAGRAARSFGALPTTRLGLEAEIAVLQDLVAARIDALDALDGDAEAEEDGGAEPDPPEPFIAAARSDFLYSEAA